MEEMEKGLELLKSCATISSERYQAFVENIQDGVYEVDLQGNFLYFNNSFARIFGYPREEIQSQNFSKFMDEKHAKLAFETFNRIFETGEPVSDVIWRVVDKEGNERIIELSASLIRDEEGGKIGFRGVVRDVTEKFKAQEALKRSEQRYRTLLDFVPYPIVVFTPEGKVTYLNPAFTETFGWTLDELRGKNIPYVPPELQEETSRQIKRLMEEKVIRRLETQRLTKDGRRLDVVIRAAVFSEDEGSPSGELVLLRDITHEKRIARNNEILLKISMALPEYPDLEELLEFISNEVKSLVKAESALVVLLDEERQEFFFKAAAHDDDLMRRRVKEIRFPSDQGISGRILKTGKPLLIEDMAKVTDLQVVVDREAGLKTHSLIAVPLRSHDRIIGVLCALNKKEGVFDKMDLELLNLVGTTVALSIENARFADELKKAYVEVSSLSRAKDKVINRLSHELKTPLSVLSASLVILSKKLSSLPKETWEPTINRARRNLERLLDIQYQVEDIVRERRYESHQMISWLLDQCADQLETLVAEEVGEGKIVESIRAKINELFGIKEVTPEKIYLHEAVPEMLAEIGPSMAHRDVQILQQLQEVPPILIPREVLKKVFVGLVRNAVENTPDKGKIEIILKRVGDRVELTVRDYGIGITAENQGRIFEGFFMTQETLDYSSRKPFDFNAGGKGADLLRARIFSERYNFQIVMSSSRCIYIPRDEDQCPGDIEKCRFCKEVADCHKSGGSAFTLYFSTAKAESDSEGQ